ncbi:MAG: recombinase family protein, partial [Cypionkella sp.]
VRRQTEAAEAYAEEFGLALDASLRDAGVSAYRGDHRQTGALAGFLTLVRTGEIAVGSFMLVDSFDRLSRERPMDAVGLLCDICRAGITIVTLNDRKQFGPDTPMERMMWAVMVFARAHEESSNKGRVLQGRRQKERDWARASLKPFSPAGPHWLRLEAIPLDRRHPDGPEKEWIEIPERVAVMREIFDLKASGLGYVAIARLLNQRGEPTPRGRRNDDGDIVSVWTEATVGDLLYNRAVLGEYAPHKGHRKAGPRVPDGPPITGFYPAIISQELFDRVHAGIVSRQNPNARPRTSSFNNLLIGHVRCGGCGAVVGYLESTRAKGPSWKPAGAIRCPNVYRGACDERARLPYHRVEAELLPFLAGLPAPKPSTAAASALATARAERTALATKISNLEDAIEEGQDVGDRLRQRQAERVVLDVRIKGLEAAAVTERATAASPDWRSRLDEIINEMARAEGDALYAVRARLNLLIGQAVPGGFRFQNGRLYATLQLTRAKGRPPLFHGREGGLIMWELTSAGPGFDQTAFGADGALISH